jgi:hypothetical protein
MKIVVGKTYYYEDFITVDEQLFLRDWALRNEEYLIPNPSGPYRKRKVLKKLPEYPNILNELKDRLMVLENINSSVDIITNGEQDMVSIQRNMGMVPEHIDYDRLEGYYLRRYNVFVSLPEEGGLPIYDGEVVDIKERSILRVDAGLMRHSTTKINGETPRIMLSYGFNVKRI